MITLRRALLPALAALALVGCGDDRAASSSGLPTGPDAPPARRMSDLAFERNWDVQLPGAVEGAWITPALPDLMLVQVAPRHELVAIDITSGDTKWVSIPFVRAFDPRLPPASAHTRITVEGSTKGQSAIYEDRIYVTVDDTTFSLDAGSGHVVWRKTLNFAPSGGALAVGGDATLRLFQPDFDGRMQVLTAIPFPRNLWQYNLRSTVSHPPVERDGLVYAGDSSGNMSCFKLDRELVWQFHAGGPFTSAPAIRDRALFAGNHDNILWVLNRLSGDELGHLNFNGPIRKSPLVFPGEPQRVFVWVSDPSPEIGGLYAVKTVPDTIPFTENKNRYPREVMRMAIDWHLAGVDAAIGSTPEHLFCTSGSSLVVRAVNRRTGKVDWTWDPEADRIATAQAAKQNPSDAPPITRLIGYHDGADRNRSLFTVDASGKIVAWRLFTYQQGDVAPTSPLAKTPAAPAKQP